jgi:hypothetical protein
MFGTLLFLEHTLTAILYLHVEGFFMLILYWKKKDFSVESFSGFGLTEAALSFGYLIPLALHHLIGHNLNINSVICRTRHGALMERL